MIEKSLSEQINWIRNPKWNNISTRIKDPNEVWTSIEDINKILDTWNPILFKDPSKILLDPTAGVGIPAGEMLIRRLQNGLDLKESLETIRCVEIVPQYVDIIKKRLSCGRIDLHSILDKNIVSFDALRYNFKFDNTDPYKTEQDLLNEKFFEIN